MALIRCDGFDIYGSATELHRAGWGATNTTSCTLTTTEGRYGGGALKGTSNAQHWHTALHCAQGSTVYVCFAHYHDAGVNTEADLLIFKAHDGADLGRVAYAQNGTMYIYNNPGTLLETSVGNPLTGSTWHFVEVKFTPGTNATTGEISVKVDGSLVLSQTSIDTFVSGNDLGGLAFSGNNGTWWTDDVILMDTTGSYMNGYIGDTKIETLGPNGDGGVVDWTRNTGSNDYQAVDDLPTNDDTDYVASSTATQETRFTMANLSVEPTTIHGVVVRHRTKKADAGLRTVRVLINSGGTEATSVTEGLQTDYVWHGAGSVFYEDPDTTDPWEALGVNGMQAGLEVVS